MPLCATGDSISSITYLGNSFLQLQQQILLRNIDIGSPSQQIRPSRFFRRPVQCTSNLTLEVFKAVFRLKKQGIQVTPKVLHRVKKKEAWKAQRRERKEREKTVRVTDPVWYEWPDEQAVIEKRRLSFLQDEEDEADKFLTSVNELRPAKRIEVHDVHNASRHTSKRYPLLQKRGMQVRKSRRLMKAGNGINHAYPQTKNALPFEKQRISQTVASDCMPKAGGVSSPQPWIAESLYPWNGNHIVNYIEASEQELQEGESEQADEQEIATDCTSSLRDHSVNENLNPFNQDTSSHIDCKNYAVSSYIQEEHICNEMEPDLSRRIVVPQAVLRHGAEHNFLNTNDLLRQHEGKATSNSLQGPSYMDGHAYRDYASEKDISSSAHTLTNMSISHLPALRPAVAFEQISSPETFLIFDKADQHVSSTSKQLPSKEVDSYARKELPKPGIEKFLDLEIQEAPKRQEIWKKGVGLVKQRKPPFSREIKERILARRRGDWSVLYEAGDLEDGSDASTIPFDGRAALIEDRKIQRLAARLHKINYWTSKLHFSRLMHSGRMKLTEDRVLRVIQILGENGNWRRAMQVVQWVHKRQHYQFHASKFVFTTLLSILGKARRPVEALNVFNVMREKFSSYPDMAAYHTIACSLGQAGQLRELLNLMESLEIGPPQPIKFIPVINWEPSLYPDIVVYNAVLTACISTKEWAGVSWLWKEIKKKGIKPNGATFGLTIEAMVKANKFDQVVRIHKRMERAGFPPNSHTYKSLVEAFGKQNMTDEAVELVKEMEASGIVGSAGVYYALACSFCVAGKIKEALVQVRKIKEMLSSRPDVITYTGLIRTCHRAGRIQDAIFLFKHMQHTCAPNVRTCNDMIKIYGWNNMFNEAKDVYEGVKKGKLESCFVFDDAAKLSCDSFTFELMLKAAVVSEQWGYFDEVYWDMTSQGYYLSGRTNQWLLLKVARQRKIDVAGDMLHHLRKSGEIPHLRFYEALILSCIQAKRFRDALLYLNITRIDGYKVLSIIQELRKQVDKEAWDSFLSEANVSQLFSIIFEETQITGLTTFQNCSL